MTPERRALGLLLFSTVVSLSICARLLDLKWLQRMHLSGEKKKEGKTGEFILKGSTTNFVNGRWKAFVSTGEGEERNEECEIEVVNEMKESVVFCWVDECGKLHHFTQINDNSIADASVSHKHVELANTHHAFLCMKVEKEEGMGVGKGQVPLRPSSSGSSKRKEPKFLRDVSDERFIFIYKPTMSSYRHQITISNSRQLFADRGSDCKAHISLKKMKSSGPIIDTSTKQYPLTKLCDFAVNAEPGVFDSLPTLRRILEEDLQQLCKLLPPHALRQLQRSTPLWLNRSISYGPVNEPIVGDTCCFHPKDGQEWLKRNGMRVDKAGGIEIYCAQEYLQSRGQWGTGGLLLHEYCHAYHNKFCSGGYECKSVRDAYNVAMNMKLYDCVNVHGKQGEKGPQKAYCCANCMEFFAELSVAFLYRDDDTVEFNKWYPHNFAQLKTHDPESCAMLARMWGIDADLGHPALPTSFLTADDLFFAT